MVKEHSSKEFEVRFALDGKSVRVTAGTTILDACHAAGIPIDSVCDGEGKCGRCKVRPSGRFEAEPSPVLTADESAAGVVLACLASVRGDLVVEVLPRSRLGKHQILTKAIEKTPGRPSPWVRKTYVELPPATLADNAADLERTLRTMKDRGWSAPLRIVRELPESVRRGGWKVTLTLSQTASSKEIVRAEPGDTRSSLLGIAIDIGTTTIVVELVDLLRGKVVGTASDYNRQVSRGEDVIARMMHSEEKGLEELTSLVRETVNDAVKRLLQDESARTGVMLSPVDIVAVSVAGNTIMTHFFAGIPTTRIRVEPYVPAAHELSDVTAGELGLSANPSARVLMFPSRAGYLGGDIVADVLASGMHKSTGRSLLIDVGTNGEIVLGGRDWLAACSCSAGPAFEGGEVSCGMRAMNGAIDRLRVNDDLTTSYHVIGDSQPSGVCGSGLIDLVAEMYAAGIIDRKARIQDRPGGRIRRSEAGLEYVVETRNRLAKGSTSDLVVTDADLQNLLRTKAAIYGACSVLLRKTGESLDGLSKIVIAGGFGYHIDIERAVMIGMFPDVPRGRYKFIGNGSLGGARLALISSERRREAREIFEKMTYFELSVDNDFYEEFNASLFIPHTDVSRFPTASGGTGP